MTRIAIPALALMLSACATTYDVEPRIAPASTDFAAAPRVEVHLSSFRYEPRTISLAGGRPVTLALINDASGAHNFAAPEFFAAAQIAQAEAPIIANGSVEVGAGQSIELHLVPVAGGYDVECTHLGHSLLGMTGSIVVQ